ncbi:MAG: Cof-type HAD-IIB family hydrolase [Candidatus Dormibacteraeota bacterium]|nr:Cof-type HAD-IIB family hydrolase [Candidatus Dormibacteraeota bacterium]
MRFRVLAADYDGTVASEGILAPETVDSLRSLRESGRRVVLVTGRVLDELLDICEDLDVFDLAVVENGALIYNPATGKQRLLAPTLPRRFVAALQAHGVTPLSVGKAILSTWEPHEDVVVRTIHEMELDLQIIFNKHSVMVLPASVNKATGLTVALEALGETAEATVAVGDAENDLVMLGMAGCGVAVGNALASVKQRADLVMEGRAGAGVRELVERMLGDDLRSALEHAAHRRAG